MDRLRSFHRYQIRTAEAPPLAGAPGKFEVQISTVPFLKMAFGLLTEARSPAELKANFNSRPCIYGVYDGTFGGLEARDELCRGCLRCMIEHPEVARIELSPSYLQLGDGYWKPEQVLTIWNESSTGRIPVRGMGYGGPFKGTGFDGIWTDMSEIVRPTRDGIHGREYISTAVDIGTEPLPLGTPDQWEAARQPVYPIPLPIVFQALPAHLTGRPVLEALADAAARTGTLVFIDAQDWDDDLLPHFRNLAPTVDVEAAGTEHWPPRPQIQEWRGTADQPHPPLRLTYEYPETLWSFRVWMQPGFEDRVVNLVREGATCVHLRADLHGREWNSDSPRSLTEMIRSVHCRLVAENLRDRVTLIVGGGIIAAEHVPKAILCGADLVALDTAALVALQVEWSGQLQHQDLASLQVPRFEPEWAVQRLMNLLCAWRDQLLEILGAMGLRDVRRLRGEVGRAIFADEMEREVFEPIFGKKKQTDQENQSDV